MKVSNEYQSKFDDMQELLASYGFDHDGKGSFSRKIAERVTLDVVWTTNYAGKKPHWQAMLWFDEMVEISLSMNFRPKDLRDPIILQLLICA